MKNKKMMGLLLAFGLALPSPAQAASVYLQCKLSYLDGATINIALDEQAGKATWSRGDAVMVFDAAFSADRVTWKTSSGMIFVLSRLDLCLTRSDALDESTSDRSHCSRVQAPARAF